MSKELKALESIKRTIKQLDYGFISKEDEEDFILIETALKEYELIKEIRITARFDLAQVNKEHKALEIIKEKSVDVQLLKDSKNLNDYNWCVHTKDRALTQEEFDLLKGVLL